MKDIEVEVLDVDAGLAVPPLILVNKTEDATLEDTLAWTAANKDQLDEKAREHGAVLFRDFPIETDQDFDAFIQSFGFANFRYKDSLSNAVRRNRTERVFTANEAPPEVTIYLHHEMAQTPIYPSRLFFYCEQPAETGGATPLCRSDVLMDRLYSELPEFAKNCEEKGLLYDNVMPDEDDPASGMGRSWRSTWASETREQAEERMKAMGYTWEWLDNGCLRATTPRLQGVRDLGDGRKSFFNQLIAAFMGWKDSRNDPSKSITYGDGTPLDPADVRKAAEIAEELSFNVPWQRRDVALVDNYVSMHGRRTFTGTRRVLASLVAA